MFGLASIRAINDNHARKQQGIKPPATPEGLTPVEKTAIKGAKLNRLRRSHKAAAGK
jgi:hypothetical protein